MIRLAAALSLLFFGTALFGQTPVQVTTDPNSASPYCMGTPFGTAPADEINIYTGVHWHCTNQIWTVESVGQGLLLTTTSLIPPLQISTAGVTNGYVLTATSTGAAFMAPTGGSGAGVPAITNVLCGSGTLGIAADCGFASSAVVTAASSTTLSNKTISGTTNVLTNIPNTALQNSGVTLINGTSCTVGGTCAPTSLPAVPGTQYATSNGTTTGIAISVSNCGVTISCSIIAPPSYATTEVIPNFSIDPNNHVNNGQSTMSKNIVINDQRYGDAWFSNGFPGFCQSLTCAVHAWQHNWYSAPNSGTLESLQSAFLLTANAYGGGSNLQNSLVSAGSGYINKSTWNSMSLYTFAPTAGQTIGLGVTVTHPGNGDGVGQVNVVQCGGGLSAIADEGCQNGNSRVLQNPAPFQATLSSSLSPGATSLTYTPTSAWTANAALIGGVNGELPGDGRPFVDITSGVISAGTISAITSSGTALTVLTGTGTSWPVSPAYGVTTAEISAPSASGTPTPITLNFSGAGSIANITTSSLVCIGDAQDFEKVIPSSVSGSGFSAIFRKPHASGAPFGVGGGCGYYMSLDADNITSANFPSSLTATGNQNINSSLPLRWYWPIVYTSSATSASVWISSAGIYQSIAAVTRWTNTSGNNTYHFYQGAETVSLAAANNGFSQTAATLEPNAVPWTSGDTIEQGLYPAVHYSNGNVITQFFTPCFPTQACGAGITFNGPLQGSDTLWSLNMNAPTSFYSGGGGTYTQPRGIYVGAPTRDGIAFAYGPSDVYLQGGCQLETTTCGNQYAGMWQLGGTGSSGVASHHMWNDETTGGYRFGLYGDSTQIDIQYSILLGSGYVGPSGSGTGYLGAPGNSFAALYMNGMTSCAHLPATGEQCFYYQTTSNSFRVVNSSGTDTAIGSGSATSIQGTPVSTTAPTSGQALVLISGTYTPATLEALSPTNQGICLIGTTTQQVNICQVPRLVTTTSDTIATTDWGNQINYNSASAVAVTLPQATSGSGTNFQPGFKVTVRNSGAGTVTITPATSTINGAATLVLTTGQSAEIASDGTNYQLGAGSGPSGGGGSGTVNSGTGGQIAYYASTGAAVSGENTVTVNQLPGTLSLPPYLQAGGGLFIPADFMYQATLPSFSGYSTLSGTLTTGASTNGDYNAYSLYTAAFYQQTAAITTSIESVFSIGETPSVGVGTTYGGIYVCDSTNNKIWQLVINIQGGQPPSATLGSSTVTSCTTANTPGSISVAFGNLYSGLIPHLKLYWSGGTLYAYQSLNGGVTNKLIGSESVGTIASSGIVANSSEMQIYSLKVQ